jgi:hypothetical protein
MNIDKTLSCDPAKLMEPGYIRASYAIEVGPDVKLSDVLSPRYWRFAKNLKVHDTIEVISETFDALLRVVVAGDSLVVVRKVYAWEAGLAMEPAHAAQPKAKTGARIEYLPAGKKKGFRVMGEDGHEISAGHKTRAEAEAVLKGAA